MLKTLEFHAIFDPTVTELKGMLKTPEFRATYDPIVTESKGTLTNSRISRNMCSYSYIRYDKNSRISRNM